MRIAIDARLNAYRRGGIPQYTRQLLTALSEIAIEEQFISLQHRDMLRPLAVAPNVTRRTVYTPPHHRFERWTLPFEVALARPDVLHFPDFVAPTYRPCPAVVTIHDLAFMHYPQILDGEARAFYQQVLTNTHRADAVIAVSEATRQDIVQFLDVPVDDIKVIYEAAAPLFRRMDMRPSEARVLNGKPVAAGTFMLFVSTLEPRKNLPTLLQALRICIDRRPERPYKLVIVGGRGWNDEPIFAAVRDLQLADYVLLAGSVGQYDLRWLYNTCQFYINPSLYEGFGLPLLEAMACGAACLAAATSSLPEIAGDAALYVPPLEPDQWADAIETLWDDTDRQRELGRIGQARSQRFSWTRAARETLQIYHHAVERCGQPVAPRTSGATPVRRTAQPPQPAVVLPSAVSFDNNMRTCLRCNMPMVPGELQQHLRIQLAGEDGSETPVQPRAWACPNCGYAELVVEPLVVPFASAVAAVVDDSDEESDEARSNLSVDEAHESVQVVVPGTDNADTDVVAQDEAPVVDDEHAVYGAAVPEDNAMLTVEGAADYHAMRNEAAAEPALGLDEPDVTREEQEAVVETPPMTDEAVGEPVRAEDEQVGYDTAILPVLDDDQDTSALTIDSHAAAEEQDAALESQPLEENAATDEPVMMDEAVGEPVMADEAATDEPIIDEPIGRDPAILPAVDRDEGVAASPVEHERYSPYETAVLPAVERDDYVPIVSDDGVSGERGRVQMDDVEEVSSHDYAEDSMASEPFPPDVTHAQHSASARTTLELTPLENTSINSGLHDAAHPSSVHLNGQHKTHPADTGRAKHSKRSTASAKISRAAHTQSGSAGPSGKSDTDTPRGKSRSRRKK